MTDPPAGRTRLVLFDGIRPDRTEPATVGAKAAHLIRMAEAGLPVPPGFTLTTEICDEYFGAGRTLGPRIGELIEAGLRHIEAETGRRYGAARRPLLVSVRSGAARSMPGMLDTFLDVGLSARTLPGLLRETGDPTMVWDSFRRLTRSFAELVAGRPAAELEELTAAVMDRHGTARPDELDVAALRDLVDRLQQQFSAGCGRPFPDPGQQLTDAVEAVVASWQSDRARAYRRIEGLPDSPGTAVTVQAMVFGNLGGRSGSGVGFTRDPSTGEDRLYVDFLLGAQGEDVVAGRMGAPAPETALAAVPGLAVELEAARRTLESTFGDAQDFEFTVEEGRLWILQARPAKRTPLAALRIACNLVDEGLIAPRTALDRLRDYDLDHITCRELLVPEGASPLATGTPAGAGVAAGRIALDVPAAVSMAGQGGAVVLVRRDASTDDVAALEACRGLLTSSGARTCHAAVVARQLGVACVVGCPELTPDLSRRIVRIGGQVLAEGDLITVDGGTGKVYAGQLEASVRSPTDLIGRARHWQDAEATPGAATGYGVGAGVSSDRRSAISSRSRAAYS